MTGNYRQFVYLIRYQLKRGRYILFSFVHIQKRFRSTIWRVTRKVDLEFYLFHLINCLNRFR